MIYFFYASNFFYAITLSLPIEKNTINQFYRYFTNHCSISLYQNGLFHSVEVEQQILRRRIIRSKKCSYITLFRCNFCIPMLYSLYHQKQIGGTICAACKQSSKTFTTVFSLSGQMPRKAGLHRLCRRFSHNLRRMLQRQCPAMSAHERPAEFSLQPPRWKDRFL